MPRRVSYVPKHRSPRRPRPRLATPLAASGLALVSTVALSGGAAVLRHDRGDQAVADETPTSRHLAPLRVGGSGTPDVAPGTLARDRAATVSRSFERTAVERGKRDALDQSSGGQLTRTETVRPSDPRAVARAMLPRFGFGQDQFGCLDSIYTSESRWDVHADNPTSSAYGIPQALPGSKMASAGPRWADDAATQIRWGLGYIKARYGTPCAALGFREIHGWY